MDKKWQPPAHWQAFEQLCYELFAADQKGGTHTLYGRAGQDQYGVDILLHKSGEAKATGVQCKLKDELTGSKLRRDDVISIYETSCRYAAGLERLWIATTSLRDTVVTDFCAEVSGRWQQRYPVEMRFWQDIENLLSKHAEVASRFYPEAFSPDRCVFTDATGRLTVTLPPKNWEEGFGFFCSDPAFDSVVGTTGDRLRHAVAELIDNAFHSRKGGHQLCGWNSGPTILKSTTTESCSTARQLRCPQIRSSRV